MNQSSQLKYIFCSNKECRRVLAQTDGIKITAVNDRVFVNKISDRKKKFNLFYCIYCHRFTRFYKKKFEPKIKKKEKFR